MTNKELIEILSQYPDDAQVEAHCPSDGYYYLVENIKFNIDGRIMLAE